MSNSKQAREALGFSLLEIIISLGIFSLIIVSVVTLIIGSFSFFEYSHSSQTANGLLQEGFEAVNSIAENAWNEIILEQSAITYDQGRWKLTTEGDVENIDGFYRTIFFSPVYRNAEWNISSSTEEGSFLDVLSKNARIVIEWETARGATSTLTADFIITPVNNKFWTNTEWSSGPGQLVWQEPGKFDSMSNIDVAEGSFGLSAVLSSDYFGNFSFEEEVSSVIYGQNYYGEKFQSPDYDLNMKSISVYARKTSENAPGDDLYFGLYDLDTASLSASGKLVNKEDASIDPSWLTLALDENVTIASNTVYVLYVFSSGSAETDGYIIYTKNVPAEGDPDEAKFFSSNYFSYSNDSGGTWNNDSSKYFSFKAEYDAVLPGSYENSGELISSAFRASSSVFSSIEWDAQSDCEACQARFQIMTAPDANGQPGEWYPYWCGPNGKDGNEDDYFSTSTGSLIDQSMNGDDWVRYRAVLSGNGNATPVINEVRINYR